MLFNSVQFFIFFMIVATLYFLMPHRFRGMWLLAASCYFYMALVPTYILILFFLITIDYWAGILIEDARTHKRKKFWLVVSIISTCAVLLFFKYFNFVNTNMAQLAAFLHLEYPIRNLNIILPIGLSFHTFQSLSYVIEVYRGNQRAERHFGTYALFVLFFPQMVAGPIERAQNLLHQFHRKHTFDYFRVVNGLKLVLWGLFKKVVIADRLSFFVNEVYGSPQEYYGLALIAATVFFAFQVYCDFSGYSDMAIGIAQVLGFRLMDNFNRPYFAKNISEFWKRWHISLTSWFKDYVYIPLGGNRVSTLRWYFNLFFVFLLSGLWHGANWTYVIWGALNGAYLIGSILTTKIRYRIVKSLGLDRIPEFHKIIQVGITFSLICFSWIFFRANSLSDAMYIVTHLGVGLTDAAMNQTVLSGFGAGARALALALLAIVFMEFVHLIQRHENIRHMLLQKPAWLRFSVYSGMAAGILLFGNFSSQQFIYFQF